MTTVLNDAQILARLGRGELFRPGSWEPESVRGAAYDLRIADDFLVVPDPDNPHGRRYHRGEQRAEPIILRPGDVAFLSTRERICVPWDITAHIGIKFSYARRGLLVLTGLLVDPGYGLAQAHDGSWVPKDDERLHFVVANVGPHTVPLTPGREKLASIQFLQIDEPKQPRCVPSGRDMEREFFDPKGRPRVGLSFFRDMADLKEGQEKLEDRLRTLEAGTGQVVFFGVYLLAASFAAAALLGLLSLVASGRLAGHLETAMRLLPDSWPTALVAAAGLVAASWSLHAILTFIARILSRRTWRP